MTADLIQSTAERWTVMHNRLVSKGRRDGWLCCSPHDLFVSFNREAPDPRSFLLHMPLREKAVTEAEVVEYLEIITGYGIYD